MMTARAIAGRFNLTRLRRSWRGRCPACDYPGTFSVREGNGGRALLYCASCQDQAAVTEAMARATGQETRRNGSEDTDKVAARLRAAVDGGVASPADPRPMTPLASARRGPLWFAALRAWQRP